MLNDHKSPKNYESSSTPNSPNETENSDVWGTLILALIVALVVSDIVHYIHHIATPHGTAYVGGVRIPPHHD